ncbi:MAG: PEP-CTERM sorting domain-containing protein [Terrimicrobiaceae bacterium]|nr:PEP-CTERM sorting domain-containing protein [Terrimicrobiaceae bacterium]
MKIPLKKLVLVGTFTLMAMTSGRADNVTLSLITTGTPSSSLSIAAGQSFSLYVQVSGIVSPTLNNFDLAIGTIPIPVSPNPPFPTGLAISNFTDTVPSGWIKIPDAAAGKYGANAFFDADLPPGTANLVQINFSSTGALAAGNYTIGFDTPNTFLRSSSNGVISYTDSPLSLTVVPEPGSVSLLLSMGCLLLIWRRRHLRRHLSMN